MATGEAAARRLAARLAETKKRIVLAESCTAGLAAATLARVPGISNWLCGSAVTYRESTKVQWLGVLPSDLRHETAVSEVVARQMATGALHRTPEADVAVSITGHLGPNAPAESDGLVFIGCAVRRPDGTIREWASRLLLTERIRLPRQQEAASLLLCHACDALTDVQ